MNPAIAIFVKTPGHSPVKTRLAAAIGKQSAECFYLWAVSYLQNIFETMIPHYSVYWAVAEKTMPENSLWSQFPRVTQGDGSLGERLHTVYSCLIEKHPTVFLVGADCLEITAHTFRDASSQLEKAPFVMGPATDGGFYLFGGRLPVPASVWKSVPYSDSKTCDLLCSALSPCGKVGRLPPLSDIDTWDDLDQWLKLKKLTLRELLRKN